VVTAARFWSRAVRVIVPCVSGIWVLTAKWSRFVNFVLRDVFVLLLCLLTDVVCLLVLSAVRSLRGRCALSEMGLITT